MYKQIILISLIASFALASSITFESFTSMWESWKLQNNKVYQSAEEEAMRLSTFADNLARIERLNAEHKHAKFGINKFADLTAEEFKNLHSGCGLYENEPLYAEDEYITYDTSIEAPDSVDWRTKGAVTPIKDQGQCGSCWSFSTTGVIESFNFINKGQLVSLSEQQLVDCNFLTDHGCSGGLPSNAVTYSAKWGNELEATYPYKAKFGLCQYKSANAQKYVTGYKAVTANNLAQFKAAVVTMPVSVGIEADQDAFQFYTSGVITSGCGASLDHAVLVVGYTTVNGVEAFIVKNSWADTWGDKGYVYIATDDKANNGAGVCGILANPIVVN